MKSKTKVIVGLKTVKKFDMANPVCKCSTFVKSLLVAPLLLTLAGLILAGAKSKPSYLQTKVQKMKDFPKTSFTKKPFEHLRQKNSKTFLA